MDLSSVAILLLDSTSKIVYLNPPASELLHFSPGLKSSEGVWLGPVPPAGTEMEFQPSNGPGPFRVSRTSLTNGNPAAGYAGILVGRKGVPNELRRARLQEAWTFTHAELRLAEALLDGLTPEGASARLGITIHTVRTYLKRLYRRVGVHTQATLICALNQSLV